MPRPFSNHKGIPPSNHWQADSPSHTNHTHSPVTPSRSQSPISPAGFQLAGVSGRGRPPPGQMQPRPHPPAHHKHPPTHPRPPHRARPRPHHPYQRPHTQRPARPRPNATLNSPVSGTTPSGSSATKSSYWCRQPGQSILAHFPDDWILGLVKNCDKATVSASQSGYDVVVPGLCPFHISTLKQSDGATTCGGVNTHAHGQTQGFGAVVKPDMWTLSIPLVTQPMPLSALLKIPKLCAVSLYFFEDSAYTSCSTDSTGKLSNKDLKTKTYKQLCSHGLELFSDINYSTHKVLINPVCYRTLQRMACQDDWKLDEAAQFSIDNWTLKIGSENVLHFARGMRVPRPQNPNFYSPTGVYQVAVGFWTPFQQRMWDYFLTHDTGPCYLDAAYRCDHDGFQVWTLFFERQGQTVPISYLVTTGTSLRLVADWLEALVSRSSQMPRKTIFVNTLKAVISVEAVFGNWDVRFAKYYIDQAVRAVVLRRRGECPFGSTVMQAVQNIGEQFSEAIAAIKDQPDLRPEFEYLLCQEDQWMPKTYGQTAEFNYSSSAVSQWRYLLWSTMLSRPETNRVDSVLYFLASVLTPGVEEAVNALGDKTSSEVFDMSSVEQGGHSPVPSLSKTNRMPLGSSVICLFDSSASTKNIVDHHYGVCYCSKFAQQGMCEHLIYCSTNIIHQPWLVKIMDDMPLA